MSKVAATQILAELLVSPEKVFIVNCIQQTQNALANMPPPMTSSYAYPSLTPVKIEDTPEGQGLIKNCYFNILNCVKSQDERNALKDYLFTNVSQNFLVLQDLFKESYRPSLEA